MSLFRICLFSGPGAGKSRLAARLFSELTNHNIELVTEYVKEWAYQNRQISGFDQIKIFAEQLTKEESVLKSGCSIITDSPLPLQLVYAQKYKVESWPYLMGICKDFDKRYPSINILLDRTGIEYKQSGRYENEQEAKQIDFALENFLLHEYKLSFVKFQTLDWKGIYNYVLEEIRLR